MRKDMVITVTLLLSLGTLIGVLAALAPPNTTKEAYYETFFPQDRVVDIKIEIDTADLEDIFANPLQEEYKHAHVTIDGVKVEHVGVRVKGNSSLMTVANSDSDRYSFKIDFDQYIKGQSLAGLTKLNLNNSMNDPSYMREYLSYSLLDEMGIPTPAQAYANLYINGELHGLYLAVEGIEEPFLLRNFGNPLGTLYKADQGSDLVYEEGRANYLRRMTDAQLESDKRLEDMLKALATDVDLESHLDVDQLLRYFAVNTVLVNQDSYVGNFAHNYYLYERGGIFTILPWDYNMSFAGFGGGTDLSIDLPTQGISLEYRPLLGALLNSEVYKAQYYDYLEEIISEHFTNEKMLNEINRIANLIRPHVQNDPTKFFTLEQFEVAVGQSQSNAVSSPTPGARGEFSTGRAGGGMMGGSVIALPQFVEERFSSIQGQLSGETSAQTLTNNPPPGMSMPGRQGQQLRDNMPPFNRGQGGEMPLDFPGGMPQGMPEGMGAPPQIPGDMFEPPTRARNLNQRQPGLDETLSPIYLVSLGGGVVLVLVVCFVFFKSRNKYSI